MTIALKIGDEDSQVKGFIYLDAVTTYTKNMSGKVTSFPVDSGVNISDHFISSNKKISFDGVITNVDITGRSGMININGEKPLNSNPQPKSVQIESQDKSIKFLPSVVKEFFDKNIPAVDTDKEVTNNIPVIEGLLNELLSANYYNQADKKWRNKMTFTTLYEVDGINFVNAETNLVITDIVITETVDTGDSLQMSFSLEKIRLVTLDKTDMPKKAVPAVKKKVASKESQGKQDCPEGTGDTNTKSTNPNAPKGTFGEALTAARAR